MNPETEAAIRAALDTPAARMRRLTEERLVRDLGDAIGYGRLMQLAEEIWRDKAIADGTPGSEITTGPCAAFMIACSCPPSGLDRNGHCEWCCGSGRVTRLVGELQHTLADVEAALTKVGAR